MNIDITRLVHNRNIRSAENISLLAQKVTEDQNLSISRRAEHLGLSNDTLWRILHFGMKFPVMRLIFRVVT